MLAILAASGCAIGALTASVTVGLSVRAAAERFDGSTTFSGTAFGLSVCAVTSFSGTSGEVSFAGSGASALSTAGAASLGFALTIGAGGLDSDPELLSSENDVNPMN